MNKVQQEYERALKGHADKLETIRREKEEKDEQLRKALEKKTDALEQEKEAKEQLEQATPANLLAGWLRDRAKEDDYSKHLGLLAIIRRDFDTLSTMMELINWRLSPAAEDDSQKMENLRFKPKYQDYKEEDKEKDTQVSRIVLYIDDLDRCPPEKVVDVLQAVHLLLAFPLFVVVVGVDARWIKQSLKARYRQMLQVDGHGEIEQAKEIYFGKATPDDYLEKIFQIPFWLKPMDKDASWRMINGLLRQSKTEPEVKAAEAETVTEEPAPPNGEAPDEPADETPLITEDEQPIEEPPQIEPGTVEEPRPVEQMKADEQESVEGESGSVSSEEQHEEQHEETVARTELAARSLEITEAELKFMEQLAPLLGRSPRALKRFANVYRLIKASLGDGALKRFLNEGAAGAEPSEFNKIADYQAVLFLLALDTGLPDLAGDFFSAVDHDEFNDCHTASRPKHKSVRDAQLTWLKTRLELETAREEQGELGQQRVKLREWLSENGPEKASSFLHGVPDLKPLTVWAERAARFSFQVYGPQPFSPQPPSAKRSAKRTTVGRAGNRVDTTRKKSP